VTSQLSKNTFPVLWPGRGKAFVQCESPYLAHFVTITDRQPIVWEEDLDNVLKYSPTPEQLAPWILRLPEFTCHFCQHREIRGVYGFRTIIKDKNFPPETEMVVYPKEYTLQQMSKRPMLANLKREEYRREEAAYLAKTVLGLSPEPSQITVSQSLVFDIGVVWESRPFHQGECPYAQALSEAKDGYFLELADKEFNRISLEFWKKTAASITEALARPCSCRNQPIRLGLLDGIPAVCLDCVPFEPLTKSCNETCWRHVNMLAWIPKKNEPLTGTLSPALHPALWSMAYHVVVKASGLERIPLPFDAAPVASPDDLLRSVPEYGSGSPFTTSGLVGRNYDISDMEIETCDTAGAEAVLQKSVLDSIETGWLHHFRPTIGLGRYTLDPRPAPHIPEAAEWVRALDRKFPALWFFLDPDSITWVYPCLVPESWDGQNMAFRPVPYLKTCTRSVAAGASQLHQRDCRGIRLERLLHQAAIYKDIAAKAGFITIEQCVTKGLESFLAQSDISSEMLERFSRYALGIVPQAVKEKMVTSYNDGQVHGTAMSFPEGGRRFHLAISFSPCNAVAAREAYDRIGGYEKSLMEMRNDPMVKIYDQIEGDRVDLLAHLVVCHESYLNFSFHLSFMFSGHSGLTALAPVFRK
jgi:hypothetical protein